MSRRNPLPVGIFSFVRPVLTVAVAAETIVTARFAGFNPPFGLGIYVEAGQIQQRIIRLRKIRCYSAHTTALITPTGPRLVCHKFAFTGTPSGSTFSTDAGPTIHDSDSMSSGPGQPASFFDFRSSTGGVGITSLGNFGTSPIVQALTAVGASAPVQCDAFQSEDEDDDFMCLRPGQAFAIFQDTAGTAADTRIWYASIVWDEIPLNPGDRK